jgi:hypothetical protein
MSEKTGSITGSAAFLPEDVDQSIVPNGSSENINTASEGSALLDGGTTEQDGITEKNETLDKVSSFFLQLGHFILSMREYVTLGFLAFALLPLFNFATMGALAYIAYPILVLSAMQVLYFAPTSNILRDGISLNTDYIKDILNLKETEVVKEQTYSDDEMLVLNTLGEDSLEPGEETSSPDDENEDDVQYLQILEKFNLIKMIMNLHPEELTRRWEESAKGDFETFWVKSLKVSFLYMGVYFAAGLIAPFCASPMHSILASGGPFALVGTYFAVLFAGYAISLVTDKTNLDEDNAYFYQGSGIAAVASVVTLAIIAMAFDPTSWLSVILAAPGALAALAPIVITIAALGSYASNAKGLGEGSSIDNSKNPVNPVHSKFVAGDIIGHPVGGDSQEYVINFGNKGDKPPVV